jgi:hypothetical protein
MSESVSGTKDECPKSIDNRDKAMAPRIKNWHFMASEVLKNVRMVTKRRTIEPVSRMALIEFVMPQ